MNNRDLHLDFVKGFLVISMVLYHALNYFSATGYETTKYVRYVTGAFIFISGFIVATYYEKKFTTDKKRVSQRLITRGFKLLLIFTILNVVLNLLGIQSHTKIQYDIRQYLTHISSIYIGGNSRYSVFQILVPIAYLLFLSPLLLILGNWKKTIVFITLIILLTYLIFDINASNLYGLIIGLVGLSLGLISHNEESYTLRNKTVIFILFVICIFLMKYFDRNILSYSAGIIIILKLVYDFSKTQRPTKYINNSIVLLGQHSLLCYLAQIFFLQIVYRFFVNRRYEPGFEILISFIATNIFLIGLCKLVDLLRNKFKVVQQSYKFVFS